MTKTDELREALAKSADTYPTLGYPQRDIKAICTTLGITRELANAPLEGRERSHRSSESRPRRPSLRPSGGHDMSDNARIEIKPHGTARFYPWICGSPAPAMASCTHCRHYNEQQDCDKADDVGPLLYAFCGPICGYYDPPGWDVIRPVGEDT